MKYKNKITYNDVNNSTILLELQELEKTNAENFRNFTNVTDNKSKFKSITERRKFLLKHPHPLPLSKFAFKT